MRGGSFGSRLPLHVRVMAAFGVVSILVTGVLAFVTWQLASSYMVTQREHSAVSQASVNARIVQAVLHRGSAGLPELLAGLGSQVDSAVLLVDDKHWISSGNLMDPQRLPPALLTAVGSGHAARQRVFLGGVPVLAVGLPLPNVAATYVQVFPLRDLDRTLHYLSWMLLAGVAAAALAAALLGRWAANQALRPLTRLTAAVAATAAGDLAFRLPQTRDPDLVQLTTAFNDNAERLQQRVARDARFAGDVSHELRSPLTTMVNAIAVLERRRDEMPDRAGQAVDLLATDLRRFKQMLEDLLEISLSDQGVDARDLERLDLAELVRQATAHAATNPPPVVTSDPHPYVLGDRRRLDRVVANLVSNADRHGGGLVQVAVTRSEGRARIEVDDDGPGVPVADRESIFGRFARGSPAQRDPSDTGVGLGLALVAEHVRRHGGSTWVQDRPGGGARFVVELPECP